MGIPDPVTRESHGTGDKYYTELARQLATVLESPIKVMYHKNVPHMGTDMSEQTVKTQVKLLLIRLKEQSDQGLPCLSFHHLLDPFAIW